MTTILREKASEQLCELMEQVALSHEPVHIVDENRSSVLVSEEDWRSIQETLYLLSIPGMRESILEGMRAPNEEFTTDPAW